MRYRLLLLLSAAVVILFLVYLQRQTQRAAHEGENSPRLSFMELPHKWVGNISPIPLREPSGMTYHPQRQTLFVIGDEGDLYEMRNDGKLIKTGRLKYADLEGITVNPATGLLYAVVESEELILEIDPETVEVMRKFRVNRNFQGRELLKKGGTGLEAIVFIPDASHPEGGTFWVGNQSFILKPNKEPSIICEVVLPLVSSNAKKAEGQILRYFPLAMTDISGLAYDAERERLLVLSDANNLLLETTLAGQAPHRYLIPGDDQEGVALDQLGFIYIAQEDGQIIKLKDERAD